MDLNETIDATIFRAYDIRGVVGKTLTEANTFLIGKVFGSLLKEQGDNQVTIARDGRLSAELLTKALSDGLLASGCDVIDIGMVPTPLLYYAASVLDEHSGIMLTGSHNPPEYNGLKMVVRGATLAESGIKDLYQRIVDKHYQEGVGVWHKMDIRQRYINHVLHNIRLQRPLKVVVDAGNGVTGEIAPILFRELGCEVMELFCEIDGNFPNHHPDPSDPNNMRDLILAVQKMEADVGLAFDGDGDRLGIVTNRGEVICPDRLLMLFARSLLAKNPQAKIIYDIKCTHHLESLIREHQGEPIMWKTGHSLIKAKLAETHALLAGEMSGHFFFNDRWYGFDDALYAGARLLEILSQTDKSSHELFLHLPNSINTPEIRVKVEESEKFELMQQLLSKVDFQDAQNILTFDGVRVNFSDGWGLVRPSNTSPYLILRFEAINESILKKIQSLFRSWLLSVKADLSVPF